MKLSEKIQEALREQQEINLSDPAVQKRLAAQWGHVPAGAQPAPSIPEGWGKELLTIQHAMAMNNWNWNSDASDDLKREAYAAVTRLLAAAQGAKP